MDIEELLQKTPNEIVNEVRSKKKSIDHQTYLDQYDPEQHEIHNKVTRPKKTIKTDDGGTRFVDVARLSIPFQQIIVDRAAAFLIGEGITLVSQPDTDQENTLYDMMKKTWFENKLDYLSKEMARIWMSETEVAELWHFREKPETWAGMGLSDSVKMAMSVQVLAHSKGDSLYPYFDERGDMIAFGRGYKVNKEDRFDLYTAEKITRFTKKSNWIGEEEKNPLGKIPIIYYSRQRTEWAHVQHLIERFETMLSNFADSNDYFASPMVKIKGEVKGFAQKGEQGKLITLEENADADYLTWDQAPESIRLEKETLQELIFSMTQTPDISFAQMKGIGNITGIALKLMFLDADLKAKKHLENFGQGMQRRINLLKKGITIVNTATEQAAGLQIEPEFRFYLPENEQELINMLVTAAGNRAIMSRKTAVSFNPYVLDVEKELENINEDEAGEFGNLMEGV